MLTDDQIFDILDGMATAEIQQQHIHLLASSPKYKAYFTEIEAFHLDLVDMPVEQPSAQFTNELLSKLQLSTVKKRSWSNKLVFILAGIMIAVVCVTITLSIIYASTTKTTLDVPTQWINNLTLVFNGTFAQIVILANIVVLLVLFDKRVLRPYFSQRKMGLS